MANNGAFSPVLGVVEVTKVPSVQLGWYNAEFLRYPLLACLLLGFQKFSIQGTGIRSTTA